MYELLKSLSDLRGISGYEYRLSERVADFMRPYADEVSFDALGNVIALKRCGRENAPKIMLEGHMDEIGLMVSGIDEDGFLSVVSIGGVDSRVLPSAEVTVHGTRDIAGVIGAKPPHLQTADESEKSMKLKDMAIDTGLSADEVREVISVGDGVTFSQSVGKMLGDTVSLKTMDDRAGLAALINVLKRLDGENFNADIYAVAAVQEEVGCRGARTAAFGIEPDAAIAVDVCHAVTPDNSENAFEAGCGAVISVGPNLHPRVCDKLKALADKYGIKTMIDADGGNTGTDAWEIQVSRTGVPTGLLSIPLKYMHTSVETMDTADMEAVAELMYRFVTEFDKEELQCF